ncbi:MAG: response regulator [Fluviicola sp.]
MKLLLADDHPMILEGTESFLTSKGYDIVYKCGNGAAALKGMRLFCPDVVIADISMPEMNGLELARLVQQEGLPGKVVLMTMHNEKSFYKKAQEYGVWGYILKNFSSGELIGCLESIQSGKRYISPNIPSELVAAPAMVDYELLSLMEKKIVHLIRQELNNRQIGEKLFISERTIEWHRRNIIEKLQLPKEKNSLLKWVMQYYREEIL